MNQTTYKLCFFAFVFLVLGTSQKTQAQERKSLGTFNGIEITYALQYLSTDNKKKESKSRDIYQLTTYAANKSGMRLFCRTGTVGGVRVANAKSLTKSARAIGVRSRFRTADSTQLYRMDANAILQNSSKIKVPKGETPVVSYDPGCNFMSIDNFQIMINDVIANGTWRPENSSTAITLTYDNVQNGIRQQGANGTMVMWYRVGPKTFQRTFRGGTSGVGVETPDQNQVYSAKITFLDMDRILYTNSEGITINWVKNQ